jgi:hypothetical protein
MMDNAVCDVDRHSVTQRWSNYYVAGLEWLVSRPPAMDGLYLTLTLTLTTSTRFGVTTCMSFSLSSSPNPNPR